MSKRLLGYEFLRDHLKLSAFPCARPARVGSVTKVVQRADGLEVPASVAPVSQDPLEHILFALKHEGVNLQILAQCLPRIDAGPLIEAFCSSPASKYIRITACLWEQFNGRELEGVPQAIGPYVPLFDPGKYLTGKPRRNNKWRVDFNGLGSLRFCPTIERTSAIAALLAQDTLGRAQAFIEGMKQETLDRTMSWSYLSETESSFAIEREKPSSSKAEAFAQLLMQARESTPITETYLVNLQNLAVTNPLDRALEFRNRQNWLRGPGSGVLGITYVPPAPELVPELMQAIMDMLNDPDPVQSPLVIGALTSFAFVFVHPFMDGNGRLSRFLFHKAVCQSEVLKQGLVLPISVAMKRNEDQYLQALKSFSAPARRLWDVLMIDDEHFEFSFKGDPSIYRYWDATPCVEFGLRMAEQSLEVDLRQETEYLRNYDAIARQVNERIDLNSNTLALMVRLCLQNEGRFSSGKRKAFLNKGYSAEMLAVVESVATGVLAGRADDGETDGEIDIPPYRV